MPNGILQLVYVGEQNVYITENPEITYFKTIYKRHTNFAIDTIQEFFDGAVNFGQKIKCKLTKNGDLLSKTGVHVKLSNLNENKSNQKHSRNKECMCVCPNCLLQNEENEVVYGWANSIGHVLLEWIDLYIGGQLIDRCYGEWLEIWTELTQTSEKRLGYYEMVGKKDPLAYTVDSFTEEMELYIPLNFWFCKNVGLALPVMCLIYHEVEIIIKIRDFDQCWVSNKSNVSKPKAKINACILADYIYLSTEERQKFYSESHIYLIDQLQVNENNYLSSNNGVFNIELNFKQPVKEMIWFVQRQDITGPPDGTWPEDCSYPKGNDHFNFTTARIPRLNKLNETFTKAKIQLSGSDRTIYWPASYYRLWQNYFYHTRIPTANYLYTYSFGLFPEENQPAGICNMSMIDNAKISIELSNRNSSLEKFPVSCKVYATNYQVLLITAGMGSVIFS